MQNLRKQTSKSIATTIGACSLKKINYPGMHNYSQFTLDSFGRNTKIVEVSSDSTYKH